MALRRTMSAPLLRLPEVQARYSSSAQKKLSAVITERYACKAFLPRPVLDQTLKELLELTQRAPTSLNTQPYACVLVREQKDRDLLAESMLASNGRKVKEAPVVAVFAADCEPSKRLPRLQKLAEDSGAPADAVSNMPFVVRLFSGDNMVPHVIRAPVTAVASLMRPVPPNVHTEAWAFKQTTFAAATFLYAAQALGLATCPIEGFDQIRVRKSLDIPSRYSIPVVIALGYANPAATPTKTSVRLEPDEIFYDGKFGQSSEKIFSDK